jgi:hypothetical protein
MAIIEGLLGRFGYVKLERYGLILTPDGQVVSLQPAVPETVTVAPSPARKIEWPSEVLSATPRVAPVPVPVAVPVPDPAPALIPVTPARVALAAVEAAHFGPTSPPEPSPSVDEDQDEWEWHMALARARAVAADAEIPAQLAPPAPVAKPTGAMHRSAPEKVHSTVSAKPAPVRLPVKRAPTPAPIVSMPLRASPVIPVPTLPSASAAKVTPPPMPARRAARGTPSPRTMPLPPGEDTTRVKAAPVAAPDEEITRTEVKPAPLPRFSTRFAAVR